MVITTRRDGSTVSNPSAVGAKTAEEKNKRAFFFRFRRAFEYRLQHVVAINLIVSSRRYDTNTAEMCTRCVNLNLFLCVKLKTLIGHHFL